MYLTFHGLREKPFNNTPDPRFLHLTTDQREALAQLSYCVTERTGFMVLTGEIGTGKTTLLRALLRQLDPDAAVAFVFNSTLPFDGILEYVLEDFGIVKPGESRAQRLVALNHFLIERRRMGQGALLIIDEAQNLEAETLEQIRLLSNFETPTDKLLQIILVGQPELESKLRLPELRQLRQRIGLRTKIRPLATSEVGEYIRTRLRIAGARDLGIFTDRAVARIAHHSGGVPRVINTLCDHSLIIAYASRTRRVGPQIVDEAVADVGSWANSERPHSGRSQAAAPRGRVVLIASVVAGVVAVTTATVMSHISPYLSAMAQAALAFFGR